MNWQKYWVAAVTVCALSATALDAQAVELRKCEWLADATSTVTGGITRDTWTQEWTNYPRQVLDFPSEGSTVHPTQKPVALMEYLIRTYTNEGDTVLDNTMGSGTTGVACMNAGRSFLGIERDENYFEIANGRIAEVCS